MTLCNTARLLLLWLSLAALPVAAAAQNNQYQGNYGTQYGSWNTPDSSSQELVNELRQLVDKADRARAADPKFLRDLRDLAARYDRPWTTTLIRDDFYDGNYHSNPVWTVVSGSYRVDSATGLRSQVEQATAEQQQVPSDIGDVLFGALLQELEKEDKKDTSEQARYAPATIKIDKRISNAFAVQAELGSWAKYGRADLALYQDSEQFTGYRLSYSPGSQQPLALLRVTKRGESVIDTYQQPLNLEDQRSHLLEWTRDKEGNMVVKLDGATLMRSTDRAVQKDFNGFAFINKGGDYALRRVVVSGVN
jgi:hypothetical protein